MVRRLLVQLCFAVFFVVPVVLAQSTFVKGQKYVVRVPVQALTLETVSVWSGSAVYGGTVEATDSGASVNGSEEWLAAGFPVEKPLPVKKVRTDRKTRQFEVELGGAYAGEPIIKLRFASEAAAAQLAQRLLIPATNEAEITTWRDTAFEALAKKTFLGDLAQISAVKQRGLLEALRSAGASKIASETYKDKPYLTVDLGAGEFVFNTLQINRTERVARRMSDALGTVKSLYKAMGGCPEQLHGVKVSLQAHYKNFVSDGDRGADSIEAYLPCALIGQFQDADITSQALVNGSVVIVGGDRVEVSLTQ